MQTASSRTRTVRFLLNFLCLCFGFFLGVNLTVYFRLFSLNMSHIDVTDDGLPFDEKINLIHLTEKSMIKQLTNEIRLLCWVMHDGKVPDRRVAIMETWGRRCNRIIFVIGNPNVKETVTVPLAKNAELVTFKFDDHYKFLWLKTKLAFQYIVKFYKNDFDWVLKVDDDSFVVVENLKIFLKDKNVHSKFYYGFHFKPKEPSDNEQGYASGGPGYVMSMYNAQKLVNTFSMPGCYQGDDQPEDIKVGQCLALVGIYVSDSRDSYQRFRFIISYIIHFLQPSHGRQKEYKTEWFKNFSMHGVNDGFDCCSDSAISFHQLNAVKIRMLEYFIYYVHPFDNRNIWTYESI